MTELEEYLAQWGKKQETAHSQIELFNSDRLRHLTPEQKQHFTRVFYHLRGHFHDFLWFMGNHAPNVQTKKVIIGNIAEEMGADADGRLSHEQLYLQFAQVLGVDLTDEVVNQTTYLPFAREFNRRHLEWLAEHRDNWPAMAGAYSAYERLDNIDYRDLMKLAKGLGVSEKGLTFFKVHTMVTHYEQAEEGFDIRELWKTNKTDIKKGYEFIGEHQLKMWRDLEKETFRYGEAA